MRGCLAKDPSADDVANAVDNITEPFDYHGKRPQDDFEHKAPHAGNPIARLSHVECISSTWRDKDLHEESLPARQVAGILSPLVVKMGNFQFEVKLAGKQAICP